MLWLVFVVGTELGAVVTVADELLLDSSVVVLETELETVVVVGRLGGGSVDVELVVIDVGAELGIVVTNVELSLEAVVVLEMILGKPVNTVVVVGSGIIVIVVAGMELLLEAVVVLFLLLG